MPGIPTVPTRQGARFCDGVTVGLMGLALPVATRHTESNRLRRVHAELQMQSLIALSLAFAPGADPIGPEKYPPVYIPIDAPFGYVLPARRRLATCTAVAGDDSTSREAGDVILMSDTSPLWTLLYRFALTARPGSTAASS